MTGALARRDPAPGVRVLSPTGRFDFTCEGAVLDGLANVEAEGTRTVGIDFSSVVEVDGSGLTLLYKIATWAREAGCRCVGFGFPLRCRELLTELGFGTWMGLYPSEARALGVPASPQREADKDKSAPCAGQEWAFHLGRARVAEAPDGFPPGLLDGLPIQTPASGFGQVWHKVYEIRLPGAGATPEQIARRIQTELGDLWPEGASLHVPAPGLQPGAVGLIRIRLPGGGPLVTGIRVLHLGTRSFTFATLQGHMQAGWITFGAYGDGPTPVARVESLARTGDPVHEVGFTLFGHAEQERFWHGTLKNLAAGYGIRGRVTSAKILVDSRRQWSGTRNLLRNAALRTPLNAALGFAARLLAGRRSS